MGSLVALGMMHANSYAEFLTQEITDSANKCDWPKIRAEYETLIKNTLILEKMSKNLTLAHMTANKAAKNTRL